jgi:PAS domain S-box-containing protein
LESILGYSPDEMNQRGWEATIHPDDLEVNTNLFEKLRHNQKASGEMRVITKSGESRWIREYVHPVWNEQENRLGGVYGAVQDITERKQAEESLRLAQRQLLEQLSGLRIAAFHLKQAAGEPANWSAYLELFERQIDAIDRITAGLIGGHRTGAFNECGTARFNSDTRQHGG